MKELIVAASVVLWVAGTGAQGISPEDIAAAIEQGRAGKTLQKKCRASGDNGFDFVVEGPIGRIMRAAREAKGQQRQFTAADVTPALGGPMLTVLARRDPTLRTPYVDPLHPNSTMSITYRTDVVLRSKPSGSERPIVLQPVGPIAYNRENAPGFRVVSRENGGEARRKDLATSLPFPGSDMTASFDLAAFRAIPHRDVEVVIFMTDAGEHRCTISDKERRAIR